MLGKFGNHKYQCMFGEEMSLVPAYEKGSTEQAVYLPEGKWVNYRTGEVLT